MPARMPIPHISKASHVNRAVQAATQPARNAHAAKVGMFESAGTTMVGLTDTAASIAGSSFNAMGTLGMAGMLAPIATSIIGSPLAAATNYATKSTKGTAHLTTAKTLVQGANSYTFSAAAAHIHPNLEHSITTTWDKAARTAAPVLNTASKVPGLSKLHADHVSVAPKKLAGQPIMHAAMQGAWVGGSALGMYGVARSFGAQLVALRQLEADMSGKELKDVSSYSVLMSNNVSKPVAEARSKLLKISGAHAVASTAGLVMALKSGLIDSKLTKMLGPMGQGMMGGMLMMGAYEVPNQIGALTENMVGSPILATYQGLRDAQAAGEQIPAEAYAQLLIEASPELSKRGIIGQRYATEIGSQYVAENMQIKDVLAEVADGKMQARVQALNEAAKAHAAAAPQAISHVDRLKQPKQATALAPKEREVLGDATRNLAKREATAPNLNLGA